MQQAELANINASDYWYKSVGKIDIAQHGQPLSNQLMEGHGVGDVVEFEAGPPDGNTMFKESQHGTGAYTLVFGATLKPVPGSEGYGEYVLIFPKDEIMDYATIYPNEAEFAIKGGFPVRAKWYAKSIDVFNFLKAKNRWDETRM